MEAQRSQAEPLDEYIDFVSILRTQVLLSPNVQTMQPFHSPLTELNASVYGNPELMARKLLQQCIEFGIFAPLISTTFYHFCVYSIS